MTEQKAQLNYLRMAPRKMRLIANLIKGKTAIDAEAELMLMPKRAAGPVLKLLRSAIANATNREKDASKKEHLVVKNVTVDGGPMLRRFLPRARGSASPIQKKSSHITLILTENKNAKVRFKIATKTKKKDEKKPEVKKITTNKTTTTEEAKGSKPEGSQEKKGLLKRVFRRKSV